MIISHQNLKRSSALFLLTGIFVIAAGAISTLGWLIHIENLKSVIPHYTAMKFNTAQCFLISGICFLLLIKYDNPFSKSVFKVLAGYLVIFSTVSLSQDIFHWSAGIDQFFVADNDSIAKGLPFPGRMSPSTAFCFSLLAISFFGIYAKARAFRNIAQYLLHAITLTAFISLIGYLFKVPYTDKFSFFSTMALNSGIAFLLLSIAASAINTNLGFTRFFTGNGIGNVMARRLFPGMVVSLVIIGYIGIELQRKNYLTDEFGVVLSTVAFLLIGLFLIQNALKEMNRLDAKRTKAENETRLLNKNLEDIVLQRTIELKNSNDKFIKIFNSSPVCITITGLNTGEYVDVNPALLEMLKYTREELIGRTSIELGVVDHDYRNYMIDTLATKGFIRNEDAVFKDKNNEVKHCIVSSELFEDSNQKYMMSFVYDITERKIIENNLTEAKEKLEILTDKLTSQNKQLLSFAHITSHNLRSPVSNLSLLVNFYKEATSQVEKDELWGNFETVISHLVSTLDELMATLNAQEDNGKDSEELSFKKTFNSIREILIGQIRESKAIVKTDFSKAPHIFYPKIYIESIMLNLISNAIKYKSPARRPEILIESDHINGETILTVKDNGLGIDMERHGKNLFGMGKTFHSHAEARGLGLFITKTQIEAMGGEITADSKLGEGTRFKIIFNKQQA